MDINALVTQSQIFILAFTRVMSFMMIAPVFSSEAVPGVARVSLALIVAYVVLPSVPYTPSVLSNGMTYVLFIFGEVIIGLIIGFVLLFFFSVFQMAGEFFSVQMGFGATEVFDPLAEVELPILGQFYNLLATLVFLTVGIFRETFFIAVRKSFESISVYSLAASKEYLWNFITKGMAGLFESALIMAFPILGTLLLVSITTGLLAKAAPQMNLLMLGFPISISVGFVFMLVTMPFTIEMFAKYLNNISGQMMAFLAGGTG